MSRARLERSPAPVLLTTLLMAMRSSMLGTYFIPSLLTVLPVFHPFLRHRNVVAAEPSRNRSHKPKRPSLAEACTTLLQSKGVNLSPKRLDGFRTLMAAYIKTGSFPNSNIILRRGIISADLDVCLWTIFPDKLSRYRFQVFCCLKT